MNLLLKLFGASDKIDTPTITQPTASSAEFDIEGQPITYIERRNGETYFGLEDPEEWHNLLCTKQEHEAFVRRFQDKLLRCRGGAL